MKAKKILSLCLALTMALAAVPALAAMDQPIMDEWNCPVDQSGAKGVLPQQQAQLKGAVAPGRGSDFAGNFGNSPAWNRTVQGPGCGGNFEDNFERASDWK